ncbi:hypothetical protein LCGC14_1143740 [marine sediment metagenome]|uniref:AAA+ ATPase domain-containing protein n=1 Tax=marine sediment metagenome TaxID=412755 RepID=A0A0F9MKK2_9ZZZZ
MNWVEERARRAWQEMETAQTAQGFPLSSPDEVPIDMPASQPVQQGNNFSQWSLEGNRIFRPCGPSRRTLAAGVYRFRRDEKGIYMESLAPPSDSLVELDDPAGIQILQSIRKFWKSKEAYLSRGVLYKRGILIHGPAGSGKTALLTLLSQELIRNNGIVILFNAPSFVSDGIRVLRDIEPERPVIIIFEDIEELIKEHGEHDILALLDGELQINNITNLATTNFPEQLGARIANRPARFDERIYVGMPSNKARGKYLSWITRSENISKETLARWVIDTKGFSIAHLRELAIAVYCLERPYEEVLKRLSSLRSRAKSKREFGDSDTGFLKEESS